MLIDLHVILLLLPVMKVGFLYIVYYINVFFLLFKFNHFLLVKCQRILAMIHAIPLNRFIVIYYLADHFLLLIFAIWIPLLLPTRILFCAVGALLHVSSINGFQALLPVICHFIIKVVKYRDYLLLISWLQLHIVRYFITLVYVW